jgi:hypothetical protein
VAFSLERIGVKLVNYADNKELLTGALLALKANADMRPNGSLAVQSSLSSLVGFADFCLRSRSSLFVLSLLPALADRFHSACKRLL